MQGYKTDTQSIPSPRYQSLTSGWQWSLATTSGREATSVVAVSLTQLLVGLHWDCPAAGGIGDAAWLEIGERVEYREPALGAGEGESGK